jgi:putative alpha-1,2-mannosidase
VVITADDNCTANRYIQSMTLNGAPYNKNFITHADLLGGAAFHYVMSPTPNKQRGTAADAVPYSFSKAK